MPSSPQYASSDPLPHGHGGPDGPRKSSFNYRHLNQLTLYSTTTPLRIVAHVDLDAFYAQCEMVRLGIPEDKPLAVQQWGGLIAINYPSREYGMGRHITATEARKLCPEIILQHVATWKAGDTRWAYHEDSYKNMATHKVSLDPYRRQSKAILALIKDSLPDSPLQRVEKAGIDEVFIDLSAHVHSILLQRHPELDGPPPYDDVTESLPWPSISALAWAEDNIIDDSKDEDGLRDPDWDDICLCIGAEIVRDLRQVIRDRLNYTCSGGIARNKMLAKLGSAYKKPNGQTVVRSRVTQYFLNTFKFTKIRNLGGKLGDETVAMFKTDAVKDLLEVPLEQLQKLGDDTGSWLYQTIRGYDTTEVNPRTQIKSMLSAKSFRPAINTFNQGIKWLRIFAADIFSRCVEEGVLERKRKPKTITLNHRQGGTNKSKSAAIPQGKTISEDIIFDLAKNLLAQVVVEGHAFPCSNLSLNVGGFENMVSENRGIKGFLLSGDQVKAIQTHDGDAYESEIESDQPNKRPKITHEDGIERFFHKEHASGKLPARHISENLSFPLATLEGEKRDDAFIMCERCGEKLLHSERNEHMDWHFAKELDQDFRQESRNQAAMARAAISASKQTIKSKSQTAVDSRAPDKGQQRLVFKPE